MNDHSERTENISENLAFGIKKTESLIIESVICIKLEEILLQIY